MTAEWRPSEGTTTTDIRWQSLRRAGLRGEVRRSDRPNLFFPVFVYNDGSGVHSVGEPISRSAQPFDTSPPGTTAVWPSRSDGSDGYWQVSHGRVRQLVSKGFVRAPQPLSSSILYLKKGEAKRVESGYYPVIGRRADGSVDTQPPQSGAAFIPGTQWRITFLMVGWFGRNIYKRFVPRRVFPFPKSLYAVEDSLRFFVGNKRNAIVLDFFAGSGTTAHAVMRLNRQDAGRRQCISVTNNEVGAQEQTELRSKELRPGEPEWEKWGICEYITKPRVAAAITGKTPDGEPIKGDYKFTDEFPMAEGFRGERRVLHADLRNAGRRQPPHGLRSHRAAAVDARGQPRTAHREIPAAGWEVVDTYGLLTDLDQATPFLKAVRKAEGLRIAYIVTDDERRFQALARRLPEGVEAGPSVRVLSDQFRLRQRKRGMKVTLKDYQDDAVRDILANVRKARKRWREDKERHAFSLTAPTGAGKTVMAAAVFEALFHGDDGYDFDADPGAVVIWFSDDPSLNEQTRFRLMESSDRLRQHGHGGGGQQLPSPSLRAREDLLPQHAEARQEEPAGARLRRKWRSGRLSRDAPRHCARTRSGTPSATPSKTRR